MIAILNMEYFHYLGASNSAWLSVIELKLKANKERAIEDYNHLSDICNELDYPLTIFINPGSSETFFEEYVGNNKEKMVSIGRTRALG